MVETEQPERPDDEVETVDEGFFEEEVFVDVETAGEFLVELGEQLQDGEDVTITGDGWRIPFRPANPVELDIEFEGPSEPELEVEVEMTGLVDTDDAPDVT